MDTSLAHLYSVAPSNTKVESDKMVLSRLQKELKETLDTAARLENEIRVLEQTVKRSPALPSLIQRLPREIIGSIFLFTIPDPRWSHFQICDAPLVLLRICRPWRDIALSTPELWASFTVTVPSHFQAYEAATGFISPKRLPLKLEVEKWLGRSGSLPLSICIRQQPCHKGADYSFCLAVFSELLKHSRRLKILQVPCAVLAVASSFMAPDALLNLESLCILDPNENMFLRSNEFKSLKAFHFFGVHTCSFKEFLLPWASLTSLSLGASRSRSEDPDRLYPTFLPTDALSILASTPLLKACFLRFPSDATPTATHATDKLESVELKRLQSLHLKGPAADVNLLLQCVETPDIQELCFHPLWPVVTPGFRNGRLYPPSVPPEHLVKFLEIYGKGVETLSIDNITGDALFACLKSVPVAKHLELGRMPKTMRKSLIHCNDLHLALLTPNPDCICPNLETLTCNINCDLTEDAIVAFVKGRVDPANIAAGVSRIRTVDIGWLQLDFPLSRWLLETVVSLRNLFVKVDLWKTLYYCPSTASYSYTSPYDSVDYDD